MQKNNAKRNTAHSIEEPVWHMAEDDFWEYESVGDKVVNPYLILSLLEALDGKVVPDDYVFSVPELCGREYCENFGELTLAAMGEYLAMLINDGRIEVGRTIKVAWNAWPRGALSRLRVIAGLTNSDSPVPIQREATKSAPGFSPT